MRDYLRIPESKMRVAHARREHERPDRSPDRGPAPAIRSRSGSSRASRRRRACTTWPRRIACCARTKGLPPSRLVAAGYLRAGAQAVSRSASPKRCARRGSATSSSYRGAVDRAKKVRFFHDIDVLSVPSGYHEPKGLYLLEAMACGVPVVQPNHGAFPEIIARTGGGVLSRVGIGRRRRRCDLRTVEGSGTRRGARPRRRRGRAPALHRAAHGRRRAEGLPGCSTRTISRSAIPRPRVS